VPLYQQLVVIFLMIWTNLKRTLNFNSPPPSVLQIADEYSACSTSQTFQLIEADMRYEAAVWQALLSFTGPASLCVSQGQKRGRIMNFSSYSSKECVCVCVCVWGVEGGVMFISTVKMPGGISRGGVREGKRGGRGWLVWKLTSVL